MSQFAAILAIVAPVGGVGRVLRPPEPSRGLITPSMSLFGGDTSVAFPAYRLQIARMVYLGLRPAALPRLGLADDVVNLVGWCELQPSAEAFGALAQSAVTLQDDQPQLFPRIAVAALVSVAAIRCGPTLPGGGGGE